MEPAMSHPQARVHFDSFSHQIENLYRQITQLIYPARQNWAVWLDTPPAPESYWQNKIYKHTANFSFNYIWFFLILVSLVFLSTSIASLPSPIGYILLVISILLTACYSVLSYGRLGIFLFYQENPKNIWRILLVLSIFLGSGLFIYLLNGDIKPTQDTWWLWGLWIYGWLLVTIPLITFVLLCLVNLSVHSLILYGYILSYHSPSFRDIIPPLLFAEQRSDSLIPSNWFFTLTEEDFTLLNSLTGLNLNSAEKRLIPTGIVFAFVGILVDGLANTAQFQTFANSLFKDFWQSTTAWPTLIVVGIFLALLGEFLSLLATLLNRMTVSSIILETCAWAKHYRDQQKCSEQLQLVPLPQPQPQKPTFRQWLTQKVPFNLS